MQPFDAEGTIMANEHDDIRIMMRDMCRGRLEAFEKFYEQYAPLVYHVALKVTRDPMEAEEVCQDVFLEALQKIDQYDPARGSIESWLAVRTKCRSLDLVRKRNRWSLQANPEKTVRERAQALNVEDMVISEIERETLAAMLKNIPREQRQAIYNVYYQAKSYQELADRWKRPLGTVKSWVRYGIRNLKKQFAQYGWMEASGGGRKHE
jgi:RNA polymerase sigma-70 factor (ECF subfamily)